MAANPIIEAIASIDDWFFGPGTNGNAGPLYNLPFLNFLRIPIIDLAEEVEQVLPRAPEWINDALGGAAAVSALALAVLEPLRGWGRAVLGYHEAHPELDSFASKKLIRLKDVFEVFDTWWDPVGGLLPDYLEPFVHLRSGVAFFVPTDLANIMQYTFKAACVLKALPQTGHTERVAVFKRPVGRPAQDATPVASTSKQVRLKKKA